MREIFRITRIRLEVVEKFFVVSNRHFVLVDRERGEIHLFAVLVNEFAGRNFDLARSDRAVAAAEESEERGQTDEEKKQRKTGGDQQPLFLLLPRKRDDLFGFVRARRHAPDVFRRRCGLGRRDQGQSSRPTLVRIGGQRGHRSRGRTVRFGYDSERRGHGTHFLRFVDFPRRRLRDIGQPRTHRGVQEDIGRQDGTTREAVFLEMLGHFRGHAQRVEDDPFIERLARCCVGRERVPRHEIGSEKIMPVSLPGLVHREKIRVGDCRLGARVGQKSLHRAGLPGLFAFEQMKHDVPRHALLPSDVIGQIATAPGRLLQIVSPDGGPHPGFLPQRWCGLRGRCGRQTDRRRQLLRGHRLSQDRGTGRAIGIGGEIVAADEYGTHGGKFRGEHLAQTEAVHRFHHHVGDQHIRTTPRPGFLQRLACDRSDANLARHRRFEQCLPRLEHMALVVNQKNLGHGSVPVSPTAALSGNSLNGGGNSSCRSTGSERVSCNWPLW